MEAIGRISYVHWKGRLPRLDMLFHIPMLSKSFPSGKTRLPCSHKTILHNFMYLFLKDWYGQQKIIGKGKMGK